MRERVQVAVSLLLLFFSAQALAAGPCDGIRLGFHESIPAQGFFGVLTPKTDAKLVRKALETNLKDDAEYRALRQKDYLESTRHEYKSFEWDEVCSLAKAAGHSVLWIGCQSDTYEESGDYYGSLSSRSKKVHVVKAECVVSTYNKSNKPSYSDLKNFALIHSGGDQLNIYDADDGGRDRHDTLADPTVRFDLYRKSISHSVGVMVPGKFSGQSGQKPAAKDQVLEPNFTGECNRGSAIDLGIALKN